MARKVQSNIDTGKASVKNRTPRRVKSAGEPAAPFQEQDPQRRLGNFTGKGEAPRKGTRGTGIGGRSGKKD